MGAAKRRPVADRARADALAAARFRVIVALAVAVPVVMDPSTKGTFSLSKLTVLALGVCALVGLWGATWARHGRLPLWRNGLHWPLAAFVVWAAVATAASTNPRLSVLGFVASHDGLVTTVLVAAVAMATAEAVRAARLRTVLSALYLGAGGVVTAYALLQVLDRVTGATGAWDPIDLGDERLPPSWVWSTFANPNHLAGFLAVLLPLGAVLFATTRHRPTRGAVAALGGGMVLVIVRTGARGGWLAALAGVGLLAVLHRSRLRIRPRLALAGAAVAAAALLVAAPLVDGPPVARQFASIFDTSTGTNLERVEYWRAAVRIAGERPVVGSGPDTFRLVYNAHQSARYVEALGPSRIVNGAHNLFMTQLAQQGVGGLVVLLALLAATALRGAGAHRRLRRAAEEGGARQRAEASASLVLLDGVLCAGLAYVVQATFNVNFVPLQFVFALLLGLVATAALDAGVPATLRPRRVLAAAEVADPRPPAGRPRPGRAARLLPWVAAALALALAVVAVTPYRADRAYTSGRKEGRVAVALMRQGAVAEGRQRAARAIRSFETAIARHPWESTYRGNLGSLHAQLAAEEQRQQDAIAAGRAVEHFRQARRRYLEALDLQPTNPQLLVTVAETLEKLHELAPDGSLGDDAEVVALYRRAVAANPWDPDVPVALAALLDAGERGEEAREVLTEATRFQPDDPDLLVALARSYEAADDRRRARTVWIEVLEVDPTNEEARRAVG